MEQDPNEGGLNIEISPEVADGVYSNFALVAQVPEEFVLDFLRMVPGRNTAKVHSRIIMSPANVKRLTSLLAQHLAAYEQTYGTIFMHEEALADETIPRGQA